MVTNISIAKYCTEQSKNGKVFLRDDLSKIDEKDHVWERVGHYLA